MTVSGREVGVGTNTALTCLLNSLGTAVQISWISAGSNLQDNKNGLLNK